MPQNRTTRSKQLSVSDLEQKIRDYINIPRIHKRVVSDPINFNRLCAALDAIGDAEAGLHSYARMRGTNDVGKKYIVIYGVLQLLYVEQDCVNVLHEIFLNSAAPKVPEITTFRDTRNYVVGHPAPKSTNKTKFPASHMGRGDLQIDRFSMLSFKPNGEIDRRNVPLKKWVKRQQELLAAILNKILIHIESEESAHIKKHGQKKLAQILHPSLSWLCRHIAVVGTLSKSEELIKAQVAIETIENMVDNFALAVKEREEDVSNFIAPIKHAIFRVNGFFESHPWNAEQQLDFDMAAFFLDKHLIELQKIALEIDTKYSKAP